MMAMDDMLDPMFDPKKDPTDRLKLQRWRNNYRYTNSLPVIEAKPSAVFRFYPEMDPQTGEFLPSIQNGRLTWVTLERGVSFVGIRIDGTPFRAAYSFWIVPADIEDYFPEIKSIEDPLERLRFSVSHCPYRYLYTRLVESANDPDAPPDWALMADTEGWRRLVPDAFGPPLNKVVVHGIARGAVLENAGVSYEETTYDDGRSDGSLHPCGIQFGASATRALVGVDSEFLARKAVATGDTEDELYRYAKIVDPEEGLAVRMVAQKVKSDSGAEYNVHAFSLRQSFPMKIDPEELRKEWRPFREPAVEVDGELRMPMICLLTADQHLGMLLAGFEAEIMDYCFRGTPYERALPEHVRGAFETYKSRYRGSRLGHWLNYIIDRASDEGTTAQQQMPQQSTPAAMQPTAANVKQVLADATKVTSPGAYDEELSKKFEEAIQAEKGELEEL